MHSADHGANYADPLTIVRRNGAASFNRKMPGHIERLAKTRMENGRKRERVRPGFLKRFFLISLAMLTLSLLMFTAAHFYGDSISKAGHSSSTKEMQIVINGDYLRVPENKIRFNSQRKSAALDRLDLYMHWPSLSGYTDGLNHAFNNSSDNADLIFISIEPRSMSFDMSGRIGLIYEQFFDGKPEKTETGLIRQGLSANGGFIDEDLYYAAASPYPFAARCVREGASTAPFCLRDIHVGKNLMLTYRLHKKYLPQWIEVEQAVRASMKSMIVSPIVTLKN